MRHRHSLRSVHGLAMALAGVLVCAACKVEGHYVPIDAAEGADAAQPGSYWSARYGGPGADRSARVVGIAVAPGGDLVMAGTFEGTADLGGGAVTAAGSSDVWVARYRPDGTRIWSTRFGGAGLDDVYSVACDASGDTYLSGSFFGPVDFGGGVRTLTFGAFLIKLDGAGAYQWDRAIDLGGRGRAFGITLPDASTVALVGKFNGTVNFGGGGVAAMSATADSFVAVYEAASGAFRWARPLARDPSSVVAASVAGDVVVVGDFLGTASLGGGNLTAQGASPDLFLVRYRSSDGGHVWSLRRGGTSVETAYAVSADETSVYVGGRFQGSGDLGGDPLVSDGTYYDAFAAKYSAADGAHLWSRRFGGTGHHDEAQSLAVSPTRVAIAFSFFDAVDIGSQRLQALGTTADMAAVRLDPATGAPLLAAHFGSEALDDKLSIAYTGTRLAGVGTFQTAVDVFGVLLDGIGDTDVAAFLIDF